MVSLIMLDIDHFKAINDEHGHPFGDLVLQTIGDLFNSFLRATDAPCRYGGEEFAVILTETDLDGAALTAERLRREISTTSFHPRREAIQITASFGVACSSLFDKGALSVSGIVTRADDELYRAKRDGRNRVCVPK
jgi:diguanylate cyclase (GGDEF)-like protein